MNYDIDYYSGNDLIYPTRPSRPLLPGNNASPQDFRDYASALEGYEDARDKYRQNLNIYQSLKAERILDLKAELSRDYDISSDKVDILWDYAWEHGHSSGLQEVLFYFDNLYELAETYTKAK